MAQCTAKSKRTGERCKSNAVTGYTVCRMHGAGSPHQGRPGGGDGRPIITGRYSLTHRKSLEAKAQAFANDANPADLAGEILLMRALLQDYLDRFGDDQRLPHDDITRLFDMLESIGRMVERRAKMLNATALTQAEVQYLQARIADLLITYVPDADARARFWRELSEPIEVHAAGGTAGYIEVSN